MHQLRPQQWELELERPKILEKVAKRKKDPSFKENDQ